MTADKKGDITNTSNANIQMLKVTQIIKSRIRWLFGLCKYLNQNHIKKTLDTELVNSNSKHISQPAEPKATQTDAERKPLKKPFTTDSGNINNDTLRRIEMIEKIRGRI